MRFALLLNPANIRISGILSETRIICLFLWSLILISVPQRFRQTDRQTTYRGITALYLVSCYNDSHKSINSIFLLFAVL